MHGWETRMLLKHYLERGVSKAELSRRLGVSRRTIHEWIQRGQLDRDLSTGGSRYSPRPAVLTAGLETAFRRFGGVPKELLFDQMRAVVLSDQRVGGGELVLNAEFLRFAAHWGFHSRACRPYRAQTKGKVERPIRYLRDSFFYGRAFAGDEELNEQASHWVEQTANVRQHSTTGERPVERFERDEREALRPLANRPYRCLGVPLAAKPGSGRAPGTVQVERRSLRVYEEVVR